MRVKILLLLFLFTLNLHGSERIISLSPSITEILFALEKGENIVATSSYSLHPKEAQKLPVIGGYEDPHIERILGFSPTLVIGQFHNQAILDKLKHFAIPTLLLDLKSIQSIQTSIRQLATHIDSHADSSLIKNIQSSLEEASKNTKPHSVLIVYGLQESFERATYIAGHDIFFEDIIQACGNTNAYTENTTAQPTLSYENIVAINPQQVIILHSLATQAHIDVTKALGNWYSLPIEAAKNKKISILNEDYIHIPSHRIALTIQRLCGEMND